MEWQAIVLVIQILLLAVGYFLFQQARAELTAHAASTPILAEVKALQRGVKSLIAELQQASEQASDKMERRCADANALLVELDLTLRAIRDGSRALGEAVAAGFAADTYVSPEPLVAVVESTAPDSRETRRRLVYDLADAGEESIAIAREAGLSEGEVETMLGLRRTPAAR